MSIKQRFTNLVTKSLTVENGMSVSGGLDSDGVPLWSMLNRNAEVFFVDPTNGAANNIGTRDAPVATMTQAIALCTDDRGDVIVRLPGSETPTAAIEFNRRAMQEFEDITGSWDFYYNHDAGVLAEIRTAIQEQAKRLRLLSDKGGQENAQ